MLELSFEKEVFKTLTTGSNQMGGTKKTCMVRRRINYGLIFAIN